VQHTDVLPVKTWSVVLASVRCASNRFSLSLFFQWKSSKAVNQVQVRYLIGGLLLLALAVFNFITYTNSNSLQSTFNILSGDYEYLTTTRSPGDSVSGAFQEGSGSLVSFSILSSAQFAQFQTGASLSSMYSIQDVASSTISYTFTTQDTYYLLFRHGTGLINSTETVSFQRTYTTHDNMRLQLGFFFLIFAAVDFAIGFRPRKTPPPIPPPPPISKYLQGQPTVIPAGQIAARRCSLCSQVVGEQLIFCPTCGNKLNPPSLLRS
jgi:hypothetical protein